MHILALEAYDSGSHKQFLDGLLSHSQHHFTRMGLPGRKWKWRMRGSGLWFTEQLGKLSSETLDNIEVILTSDMTPVADLRALLPKTLRGCPLVCYFHENQLTYPLLKEEERDYQYGFTNITSALTADQTWFNSRYHLESFLTAAEQLLQRMPDYVPEGIPDKIRAKSHVIPLGLPGDVFRNKPSQKSHNPPVILWNHRWEYDKNPEAFFEALFDLDRAGSDFRVIVAGENFRNAPPIFNAAKTTLAHRIDHFGYATSRTAYLDMLRRADIVVSTSIHEFFGLSVLEAIAAGCIPLLPERLSYPELLPEVTHELFLYERDSRLREKLAQMIQVLSENNTRGRCLYDGRDMIRLQIQSLCWETLIKTYDDSFMAM